MKPANYAYFYWLLISFLACTSLSPLQAQPNANTDSLSTNDYRNAAVIWRGFEHHWTYNHRLNRLGSSVVNEEFEKLPCQATVQHYAATGLGGDVAQYKSYYTYLLSNNIKFQSGKIDIKLSGKEGALNTNRKTITVLADTKAQQNTQHIILLNGFDLVSEQKADKIELFRLAVSDGTFVPATGEIQFTIDAGLKVHCRSVECASFNNRFNYVITAHYLILSANESALHSNEQHTSRIYNWNKQMELDEAPERKIIKGVGNQQYSTATLGIKSLTVHLDRAHWLLDWHSALHPKQYNATTGQYEYELDLLFKQWDEDMKKESANPRVSRYAMKRKGWAMIDATVSLLQFKNAFVQHDYHKGISRWIGKNISAGEQSAVTEHPLVIDEKLLQRDWTILEAKRLLEEQKVDSLYQMYVAELTQARKIKKELKREQKKERKEQKRQQRKSIKKLGNQLAE